MLYPLIQNTSKLILVELFLSKESLTYFEMFLVML